MTAQPQAPARLGAAQTLTEWLRGWTDAQLVALLRRRPDLALPAPVDLNMLASRASVRTSISRALDGLDAFTLRTLEVLVCASPDASLSSVQEWFARSCAADVAAAVDRLADWALVWGEAVPGCTRWAPSGRCSGPYPAGLGRRAADLYAAINDIALAPLLRRLGLPPATQPRSGSSAAAAIIDQAPQLLADCSPAERSILDRLAGGPPIGALRNALAGPAARQRGGQPRPQPGRAGPAGARSTTTPSSCPASSGWRCARSRPVRCRPGRRDRGGRARQHGDRRRRLHPGAGGRPAGRGCC